MFGNMSWEATENLATWEREFLVEKSLELYKLTHPALFSEESDD